MGNTANILAFVNGSFYFAGQQYKILDMAKWVSYQSYRSPYYGTIPVSLVLCQWGFEMGWNVSEFASRYNPGNIDSTLEYSGSKDSSNPIPGKRVRFTTPYDGVAAYAHLLISGYKHVAWSYGASPSNLQLAINALNNGYATGYNGGAATYGGGYYLLDSPEHARIWATAGYSGMYSTIQNNDCLNGNTFTQSESIYLPGDFYMKGNIQFS